MHPVSICISSKTMHTNPFKTAESVFPKIWPDVDKGGCENLGSGSNTNLAKCKAECRGVQGCTAINYCHGDDCVFRGCPTPPPTPTWDGPLGWECEGHLVNSAGKI